jgi:hypothetical protein
MSTTLKAPERRCRGCKAVIPAQLSGPGRPKVFCSRACRRAHYHAEEQAAVEHERAEAKERQRREVEERWYGKRRAAQLARERAQTHRGPS